MTAYNKWDHYNRRARESGFAARSVFKLEDIDQRHKLFKPKDSVLDLGCAPGSWSQYACERVGSQGRVVGVDLAKVDLKMENFIFYCGSVSDAPYQELLQPRGEVDAVLSDMAPKTSGVRFADQERSLELCEEALTVADQYLRKGGFFLCKIFEGPSTKEFEKKLKERFTSVSRERPQAVRKASKEFYFLAKDKR